MKKLFLLIAAVLVLSVPAFAADDVYFCEQALTLSGPGQRVVSLTSSSDVYFYAESRGTGAVALYALSKFNTDTVYKDFTSIGGSSSTTAEYTSWSNFSSNLYKIFIDSYDGGYTLDPEITPFPSGTTEADIAQAFLDYLANPPTPAPHGAFSVPCGNVAYFQVSSAQTVNFKSFYQIVNRPFAPSSTYGYWSDSGQRFGSASGLPTSSTSFPLASQTPLYWSPDPQSKNFLGLSKTGLASAACSTGQWYAFYNPAYNSNNTDFTTMDITGATVSISGSFSAIKIYPLEQVLDYQDGSFVGSSNDDYTSYYDGNISEDGSVTFTDQNGQPGTPTAGGQNLLAPNETYQSIIDKVVGLLKNIVSEIKNLFSFGYEAINDLAGLMSNFGRALSGLYSWLPSEVHAALISAVSIAIVIGVFKVFI